MSKQNLFLICFALLFFSTSVPFGYAGIGIDPSWTESLVMAIDKHFVFGKDFIFNYGPLGYLNTLLLPKRVSPFVSFFFQVFLLAQYLFIIKLSFYQAGKNWWKAALISVIIFLPWGFFSDTTFTLFYLLLFWLLYVYRTRNTMALLMGTILSVLIFYIKVNLSLIAYFVFIGSMLFFAWQKIITWRTAGIVTVLLLLLTLAFAFLLNVSLSDYLASSLKIIDAYQDAQAVNHLRRKEFLLLLFFEGAIVLLVLLHILQNIAFLGKNIYLYLLIAMAWFLCFKQAHTAVAHYNVFGFFLLMPMLAVLVYLFAVSFRNSGRLLASVLILQLVATQFIRLSYTQYNFKDYMLFFLPNTVAEEIRTNHSPLAAWHVLKEKNPLRYFQKLATYDYANNFEQDDMNKARILPAAVKAEIGQSSIDIMPWEVSFVYFNKLNYRPRPIIQTYQANSDWLAQKNEALYCSANAPEYVLAQIHDYREQNPFWMDKGAYLALRTNYSLRDTVDTEDGNYFLFEKKRAVKKHVYKKWANQSGQIAQSIAVKPNQEIVYLKADIRYNLWGKLARLLYQPPFLRCKVVYTDASEENFRIPPPILKGGVLASQRVVSQEDFARFNLQLKGNKTIESLTFWSESAWGFQENFEYHFETLAE
ncbi:hypothetical protein LAG90_11975 [Marinilongibacter aquaticus]|uniref:hypothetical protein n=1 Tax=Marinilongibacter aquaticus TaxID=2975157 RepID=UPI0021BD22EA|nr:hypothetical protein [Marinilongibacter aquaticus]UBM57535.1 hypothetical protein LAG90_11975 [Marinilongibacter aquaticus]